MPPDRMSRVEEGLALLLVVSVSVVGRVSDGS
jgi:hypothetical protein